MAVTFNGIPSNLRVPLFYAEMDNSAAGTFQQNDKALLIGGSRTTTDLNIPKLAYSEGSVVELAGEGSMLVDMYRAFRRNDSMKEVWVLPIGDTAGTPAKGKLSFSGEATANGTVSLYIAGTLVSVPVEKDALAADVAEEVANYINSMGKLPATAEVISAEVTLTCKWTGATGNDIDLRVNYRGSVAGEVMPAGITVTITDMDGGSSNPEIANALKSLADEEFDYIALGFPDYTNLEACKTFMDDSTGRWSWGKMLYGGVFAAVNKAIDDAELFAASSLNDQHMSIMAVNGSPTPPWQVAAMVCAQAGKSLGIDPARPLQTLPLVGMLPPAVQDRFTISDRDTLLHNGISTFTVQGGSCNIERIITTYQKNGDTPDNSYLDVETLYTSAYVIRAMRQRITQKYGRHKLADNGSHFGAGQAIVTPNVIRAELIGLYSELEMQGIVENSEIFAKNLVVERDVNDVNRINVLFPPDYVNQLRVFAVLNQFRLNY